MRESVSMAFFLLRKNVKCADKYFAPFVERMK